MLIHPWDEALDEAHWREFVAAQGFGQFVAAGRDREVPVIVPTQFRLDGDEVFLHLARPNPIWPALAENSRAVLSVAGQWAYIPTSWKVDDGADPALGVPTTFYAAVQLTGTARVIDDPAEKLDVLRAQLAVTEPAGGYADPAVHHRMLPGLRCIRLQIDDVRAKFKYGGNLDAHKRREIATRLRTRGEPGDSAAAAETIRQVNAR